MRDMELIPAVLTEDPMEARELIEQVQKTGKFARVQVDFVDGEYNTKMTFMPGDVLVSEFDKLKFDAHLMIVEKNMTRWVNEAEVAGYGRIIAQVESISRPETLSGLAMDVHSPVAAIEPYLANLEVVIVMAVEPGFGGQEFVIQAVENVKRLVELRKANKWTYRICVDGGIEQEHLEVLEKWGADEAAVGVRRVIKW